MKIDTIIPEAKYITFTQFCEHCLYRGVDMRSKQHLCSNLDNKTMMLNVNDCPTWKHLNEPDNTSTK